MQSRLSVELGLVVTTFFWGINFLVLKELLSSVSAMALVGFRFAGLLVIGFAVLLITCRGNLGIERRDIPRFMAAALVNYILYPLCFIFGLDKTSAFSSSLLQATSPIFILILLSTFRVEPVSGRRWLGVLLSFGGIAIFVSDKLGTSKGNTGNELLGDLLTLGAALCFAAYNIVGKPLSVKYPQPKVMAYMLLFGAPPLLLLGLPTTTSQNWAALSPVTYLLMIYTIICPIYLAYMLWNRGIARAGIAHTSLYSYMVVVLTGIAAFVLLGEDFGMLKIVGALVVIGGLILTRSHSTPKAAPPVPLSDSPAADDEAVNTPVAVACGASGAKPATMSAR